MPSAQLPRRTPSAIKRLPLSSEQFHRIVSIAKDDSRLKDLLDVMSIISHTCLRRLELEFLRWDNVDALSGRAFVTSNQHFPNHGYYRFFGSKALGVLEARRTRVPESKFVLGDRAHGLLNRVSDQLQAIGNRVDAPMVSLNDIRLRTISRLIDAGASSQSINFIAGRADHNYLSVHCYPTFDQLCQGAARDLALLQVEL